MKKATIPAILVVIMWVVWLIWKEKAITYGIHPRDVSSLKGIIFSPFIHGNLNHILSNTLPILILSIVLAIFYNRIWLSVWFLVSVTGGALVWLFARASTQGFPTYHVGASITIFGILGFLLASGIFRKTFRDFFIALIIGILYGGALYGILPTNPHISWEGHLFGLLAGIFWAYVFRKTDVKQKKKKKEKYVLSNEKL